MSMHLCVSVCMCMCPTTLCECVRIGYFIYKVTYVCSPCLCNVRCEFLPDCGCVCPRVKMYVYVPNNYYTLYVYVSVRHVYAMREMRCNRLTTTAYLLPPTSYRLETMDYSATAIPTVPTLPIPCYRLYLLYLLYLPSTAPVCICL
jgi:hypothetical protein